MGKDWCMLAVQMGLSDKVPKLDVGAGSYSQTARLLDEWARGSGSSLGHLITALHTLGRQDAVDCMLSGCSIYKITQETEVQVNNHKLIIKMCPIFKPVPVEAC